MLLLPPKIFLVFSLVLVGLFLIYPTVNAAGCSIDVFWRWTDGKDYSTQPSPISVSASIKAVANFNSCNINKSKDSAYFLIFSPGGSSGQRVGLPLITTTFVQYNADIELVELVCQTAYYDENTVFANRIDVSVNASAIRYLEGFSTLFAGYGQPNGIDYQFIIRNNGNNFYNPPEFAPVIPPDYYKFTAEWNSLIYWNSLNSIVFTSASIGIRNEYIPTISQLGAITEGVDASRSIITDFVPLGVNAGEARTILQYNATLYRLIDLTGSDPLTMFNFQVWWTDQYFNFYPLLLTHHQSMNVKFIFIRKASIPKSYNITEEDGVLYAAPKEASSKEGSALRRSTRSLRS